MAQVKRYKAKKDFKLDCGHEVKAGQGFVVTKFFSCEIDGTRLGFPKVTQTPVQK
jgi:hypothetical protein